MLLKSTNIEEQFKKLHTDEKGGRKILASVHHLLRKDTEQQDTIEKNLNSTNTIVTNPFDFDLLAADKIYHIDQIKKICIDYRLRFLDTEVIYTN